MPRDSSYYIYVYLQNGTYFAIDILDLICQSYWDMRLFPLVHWKLFWLWPKGQTSCSDLKKRGLLTGNIAPTFHKFHSQQFLLIVSCLFFVLFFNENILFIMMQGFICYSGCYYLSFRSQLQDFAKKSPVFPRRLWTMSLIFLYFVSIFSIVPPALCNFINLLFFTRF